MTRPAVSVVMSTYNRGHLLCRSIYGYNASDFDLSRLEVVVVDDGSDDYTGGYVRDFDPRIDLKYVRLRKEYGLWRDCAATINHGIRISTGDVVLITHPEIVPGRHTIAACAAAAGLGFWASAKGYYLKPADMAHLGAVKFDERGPLACRDIPGFYDPQPGGKPDYHPAAIDRLAGPWYSWIFGGLSRENWKWMGGVRPTRRWGAVDIDLLNRRRLLGIDTATPKDEEAIVCHLNHDLPGDVRTPRVEMGPGGWREELDAMPLTPETAGYPAVDEIGW